MSAEKGDENREEKLIRLMCTEFKYYQIAYLSLLLKRDKMNDAYNESKNEKERSTFYMKLIIYSRVGGAPPQ
jgi:hypothetical protein